MWQALRAEGRSARADAGVSRPHQLCELVALRLGEGKLEPADYYKLRLYRRGLSFEEKRKYFSNQAIPPSLLGNRTEENPSALQSLMPHSYAVFCMTNTN